MIKTQTVWNKPNDHPAVWADYVSSCGGDTDNGRFYIGTGDNHTEVFPGDIIYDMYDGSIRISTGWDSWTRQT